MRTLLLSPHYDDETLFAAYTVQRHQPDVLVVAVPKDRDEAERRNAETAEALKWLGHTGRLNSLGSYEGGIDPEYLVGYLEGCAAPAPEAFDPLADPEDEDLKYDRVFAPAVEDGGHDDHNLVGRAAVKVFGPDRVIPYLTYTRGGGRSRGGVEVPATPAMIEGKLLALACHRSQIEHPARRPWFYDMLDMREWLA